MTTKRKLTFAGMFIAFCLLLCCVFGFLFSTTGGNTAYAYSSSTKYKLDLTATGTSGIYIYTSGATGSGTVSNGAAFNFAPNRVDVVLTKKTELGRYTYTRYVKDFALTGPVTYSSADKQKNSSKSSEKTVTYTLPTLTNGSYTLTMTTGQDYSGMIGDASTKVTFNFIVDKNRPTISGASVSTTGKYTNKAFTVTASDLLSGIDKLYWKAPTASIYSSTTATSKTISAGSTNGRYTFYAVDKAGNQSSYYYVYYDNVVPTGTIKGTSGTLSSGSYTNKAFSYSATDSGSGINYLQYKKPGSSTWTSYTSGTTIPATSTNGWYYFRAYDNAGNVSAESSVCLDTAVPTGTVYKETTSVSSGSSVKGAYIKFVATDSLSGVANCYVKAPGETSYKSYTSNSPLTTEGVYQFYIVDRAGNQSSTYSIALDNTAPTGMVYGGTTEKPSGSIVNSSYIKFIGSDNASGVSAMYVKKPGSSSFISYTSGTQFTADGKYEFYCVDGASNQSQTYNITLDRTKPVGTVYGGTQSMSSGARTGAAYVKYTATDALSGVSKCYVKKPGSNVFTAYTAGEQLAGDGTYEFYSVDVAGNESEHMTIMLDNTKPVGQIYGGTAKIENGRHINAAYIRFAATDEMSGVAKLYVKMPGDKNYAAYNATTQLTTEGQYSFYAEDEVGNESNVYTVTLDRTAPVGTLSESASITNAADITYSAADNIGVAKLYVKKPGESKFTVFTAGTKFTGEGEYEFYSVDAAGNKSLTVNIMVDRTKPVVTVNAGGKNVSDGAKSNAEYVRMSATDALSGISKLFVKIPGASNFVEYTSGTQLTAEGEYSFYATDNAGNQSAAVNVLLDRTKPTGQITAAELNVNSGEYTNKNYVKFTASDDASGVANLYVKTPGSNSYISYSVDTMLTEEGKYEFYVTDSAGNKSETYIVTIDRTKPAATLYGGSQSISDGDITAADYIRYEATDSALSGVYVKKPGETAFVKFTSGERFTADGKYEFYAEDLAGNRSETVSVTLDTTAPAGQLYAGGKAVESGSVSNAEFISYAATDATSGIKALYVKLPGKSGFTAYESGTNLFENGKYEFYAVDVAGNIGTTLTITLDNIAPAAAIMTDSGEGVSGTTSNSAYITFSATDATSGIAALYVRLPGKATFSEYAGERLTDEGVYSFYAVDVAGNRSEEIGITLDRTAPVGKIISGKTELLNNGYTNQTFLYSATDVNGITKLEYKIQGGEWQNYVPDTEILAESGDGEYVFRAYDLAGNVSEEMRVTLDTKSPRGVLYANNDEKENGAYTNYDRISFIGEDENLSVCYVRLPNSKEWTPYTNGALYSESGKYQFKAADMAGNESDIYTIIVDRTAKAVTLSNVQDGKTSKTVILKWQNGDADVYAPVIEVTVNGIAVESRTEIGTLYGGKYIVVSKDAAGNVWTSEFVSERVNINAVTSNKEWWECGGYAFETYDNALDFMLDAESALVRTGEWNSDVWDTGIMMDAKDSVNAKPGKYFIYKKSGDANVEVAYFTEARLQEVMLEYAVSGITHYYYWQKSPAASAEGNDLYVLNTQGTYIASEIGLSDKVEYIIDGKPYSGSVYAESGKHSVIVKDAWGNEAEYTFVIVRNFADIQMAVGEGEFSKTDVAQVFYLKDKVHIAISDTVDEYAMFYIEFEDGSRKILSLGETYEIAESGKYIICSVNHFGLSEEVTIYISLDEPAITFDSDTDKKQLIIDVTASADSYAKLQSIAIYKSVDGGDTWVQLTADDYGTVISEATKQYKFCTSGMYRVVVEDTFHTGFEAIEGVTEYTQIGPAGVLSGVENGGYTNKNVKFTWTDNATAVITVNGETSEYTSGTTLSDDGEYEIVLTNKDGQTFVVSFVIDKTAPEYELTGADNGATVNNDISLAFGEDITAEVSINGDTTTYMSGEVLTAEGEYEFTLTDKAGNKTVVNVFVDKTADYGINTVDGFVSNDDVVIKANEELTINLSKDGETFAYEFGASITEEGNYIAHISDAYGNTAEVSFRVLKTTVLNDFAHDFTGVNIVSSTCNGEPCELNFAADGKYEITATDGEKEYTFVVILDRVAPEIVLNGAENGGETKSEVVVESISEAADITVYFNGEKIEYRVGASVSELGEYRVVVTDAAGNTREYTFTIVYGLNGGAIALIVIFVLFIVGIILGIVFGKRAVYKKKLAQKSQEEGSDEDDSDMEDSDAANFEPDDEQTANSSEDADEETVEEVVDDDEDIETDNDEREE